MKRNLTILISCLMVTFAAAQKSQDYRIAPFKKFKANPSQYDTAVYIKNLEAPYPDGDFDKMRALELKKSISEKYPRKFNAQLSRNGSSTPNEDDTLAIGRSIAANIYNLGVPSDNSLAISDSGLIVSCVNTTYLFYNSDSLEKLASGSLESFAGEVGENVYDPKMIYDPKQDRFIAVMLKNYSSADTNEIIIGFSSTNNPMDEWYIYSLTGNPFNNQQWSDYPAISITDDELFITVNLLTDTSGSWITGFRETIIWQVDKQDGYTNDSLNTKLWSDLWIDSTNDVRLRNLHPIRNYNHYISDDPTTHTSVSNQLFLSNRNFAEGSDTIMLVEISGNLQSNPTLTTKLLRSDRNYYFPVNGKQPDTTSDLLTNDSRVLGAIYNRSEDLIQFVQHSTDTSTGNVCVYHGQISSATTNPNCTAQLISEPGVDFGYPNIASMALLSDENLAMICYNYSSDTVFPSHGGIMYRGGNDYSQPIALKEGVGNLRVLNGDQRWGDYSGIQRRYNDPGKIWFEGIFGKTSGIYGNWISEVHEPIEIQAGIVTNPENKSIIYPNPVEDKLWFKFEVPSTTVITAEIYDSKGSLVTVVFEGQVKNGENLISMNTLFLKKGQYSILLKSQDGIVAKKKFARY